MPQRRTEIKVGLTVALAATILLAGLLWIKGYRYGHRYYAVRILFPDVGNLETGDPVSVNGVNRGKVRQVELHEGQVLVTVGLGNDVSLKTDAEFAVKNIGLMGERFVDVRPGKAATLLDMSAPAQGFYDTGIPEVMGVLGRMVNETRELVLALREHVGSDSVLGGFVEAVENTRRLTADLRGTISDNRDALTQAAQDVSLVARKLREFAETHESRLEHTVTRFDSAAATLMVFSGRLDTLSVSLRTLVSHVEKGEGTLGLLLTDDDLYNQLKTAAQDLEILVSDIRANPKKYLHVQVKLF